MDDLPLADAAIRAWRANEQAKALRQEIGDFISTGSYLLAQELESKQGNTYRYVARLRFKPLHPLWNVRIGEILHNFRASLDNAVWELVSRGGGTPKRDLTSFPITDREELFHDGPGIRRPGVQRLEGVIPEVVTIVEAFQPYRAQQYGLDPHSHPLWVLRQLSDIDKHRTLHTTFMAAKIHEMMTISTPEGIELDDLEPIIEGSWLVDGARLFTFHASRPAVDGEVQISTEFDSRVVFDSQTASEVPAVKGLNIMTVLGAIDDEVKAVEMSLRAISQIAMES